MSDVPTPDQPPRPVAMGPGHPLATRAQDIMNTLKGKATPWACRNWVVPFMDNLGPMGRTSLYDFAAPALRGFANLDDITEEQRTQYTILARFMETSGAASFHRDLFDKIGKKILNTYYLQKKSVELGVQRNGANIIKKQKVAHFAQKSATYVQRYRQKNKGDCTQLKKLVLDYKETQQENTTLRKSLRDMIYLESNGCVSLPEFIDTSQLLAIVQGHPKLRLLVGDFEQESM